MKLFTTPIMTTMAFLCLGIPHAHGQQKTLKELIVGTWVLDSVYDQTQDGKKNDTWGPGVKGIAVFDATDCMSVQIIAADRRSSKIVCDSAPERGTK